ncbi:hypothetical protein ACFLT7_07285 [candidate division KSB1 bacterium]
MLADSFIVGDLKAPNGPELVQMYVGAFKKVFDEVDLVLEIFKEKGEYASPGEQPARIF